MKTMQRFLYCVALVICLAGVFILYADRTPRAFAQAPQKLRVAVVVGEPFVIATGNSYTGYSIDYWEKLAAAMGVAYEYILMDDQEEIIAGLEQGKLDAVIGGVGLTSEREARLDFTQPYYMSGLQILVLEQEQQNIFSLFAPFLGSAVTQVFVVALIFALIMAHVIYLVEHFGRNPEFQQGYFRDIWEAFWYLLIIVATGEYGDKEARTPIKRIVTVAFWLLGVLFIAQFTAAATSSLTVQQLQGSIQGLEDLPGKRVVTVADSPASEFLEDHHIPYEGVTKWQEAYARLLEGNADALVGQAPILQYFAANQGKGRVQVVGPILSPVPIGIGLPEDSPLHEPLNRLILQFYQDGTYGELASRWLGTSN
jgi:polar amino acid transport system substrate-binding protein